MKKSVVRRREWSATMKRYVIDWKDSVKQFRETREGCFFDFDVYLLRRYECRAFDSVYAERVVCAYDGTKYSPQSSLYAAIRDKVNHKYLHEVAATLNAIKSDDRFSDGYAAGMNIHGMWTSRERRRSVLLVARTLESIFDEFVVRYDGETRDVGHEFECFIDDDAPSERLLCVELDPCGRGRSHIEVRVRRDGGNVGAYSEIIEAICGETIDDAVDLINQKHENVTDEEARRAFRKFAQALMGACSLVTCERPDGDALYNPLWMSPFRLVYRI